MKQAGCLIGLCGLASSALAQNFSLTLAPSAQTIDTSGGAVTITVTVIGDADLGPYLSGGSFGIQTDSASIIDMQWHAADWSVFNTDGGYAGNGNYNQVIFGQLFGNFFPPPDSSLVGNPIGAFQVTIAEHQVGQAEMSIIPGTPFTLETADWVSGARYNSNDGNLTLNSTTLTFVPAPGAASLLAFAGVVVTRRRRR
ncbi:MAG: hypothetical protein KDA29_02170 [Phycisphaerales bacterium]|nr:hypothetical protein [Phycisphaerales bacterium]